MSPGDLDLVMSHGLGLRYAFLGPLETMHLNAEGRPGDGYEQSVPPGCSGSGVVITAVTTVSRSSTVCVGAWPALAVHRWGLGRWPCPSRSPQGSPRLWLHVGQHSGD